MPSNLITDEKGQYKKGPGRPKGSPNKINKAAKDAIADAAEALGGSARLVDWVMEDPLNERAFWSTIYPKLIPHEVTGPDGGPLQFQEIVRKIVDSND
jgi:hypothetical protein